MMGHGYFIRVDTDFIIFSLLCCYASPEFGQHDFIIIGQTSADHVLLDYNSPSGEYIKQLIHKGKFIVPHSYVLF